MNGIPTTTRTRVYDVVADELVAAGVECIFGVMGEDTAPLCVAAVARGIAYHAARHENQAVAMADGYSRATGRTGIATVTGGPGFTNAMTALNTAQRANSRVVVLAGAGRATEDDHDRAYIRQATTASLLKFYPHSAALDLVGIKVLRPEKGSLARAHTRAALACGRERLAVLILGRALLLEDWTGDEDVAPALHTPRPVLAPDPQAIGELADLLCETWAVKQPLIIAGRGAGRSGAAPALARLGELTGALLATTLPMNNLFRGDPWHIGICGTYATPLGAELITQADCVLAFGATLNPLTTYSDTLFPKALVAHIDSDGNAHGRFRDVDLAIRADARLVAEALVAELEKRGHANTGFRTPATRERIATFNKSEGVGEKRSPDTIDPRRLALELDRMLPAGRILCCDAGQHARFTIRYVGVERPENFMQSVDAGSIGLGIGTAIGTAIGRPGELVVAAIGDTGMMMSLGDLETVVRLRLPILVLVSNDEALGAEVNVLADLGMETKLAQITGPSFAAIAEAMGARAATVRSVEDLAIVRDWLAERSGRALVLDCRVNPEVRA